MTAMNRTDSEMLQDVMIVMTVVEIDSVAEIATMTEVAETMIVEVCSVSSIGFTQNIACFFLYDTQN